MRRLAAFGVLGWAKTDCDSSPLASSVVQPFVPTTVFVHGLDSSKQTWTTVQAEMTRRGLPTLALDLRGHGESKLGDPQQFSSEALARDVVRAVDAHGVQKPWILVGHSMGGRVAMRVAAIAATEQPDLLAACVIEDMDTTNRWAKAGAKPDFDRAFESWPAARDALVRAGYDSARVDDWRESRVRLRPDGTWWSDVNPEAAWLASKFVLASDDGDKAWDVLAAQPTLPFALALWVASDQGTVCRWQGKGGIHDLQARVPSTTLIHFKDADHSIHNTARPAFVRALLDVIDTASK